MKWITIESEKDLPKETGDYFVRSKHGKFVARYSIEFKIFNTIDVLEWLDESNQEGSLKDWKGKFYQWKEDYRRKRHKEPMAELVRDWIEENVLAPLLQNELKGDDLESSVQEDSIPIVSHPFGSSNSDGQDKGFCLADILLPGATLDDLGGEIDINDPETQRLLKDSVERQRQILAQLNISDEQLNQRITI